jgi:citrate synthase
MTETKSSPEFAEIKVGGKILQCPVITGTENEKAFDIAELRAKTGYVTYDNGYGNTASCTSAITFLDGEKGILRYRGIPIEDLAETCQFTEVAYLLINGHLPTKEEQQRFSGLLTKHAMIHEDMKQFFDDYPGTAHPMATLSSMVCALSAYYPELLKPRPSKDEIDKLVAQVLAKVRTIAAFTYKKSIGEPFEYPKKNLKYVENFLHMMFSTPEDEYKIDDDIVNALRVILILHADHEQNCSTSTVRLVGSSQANMFASISAGICALWGPLHGGANQAVMEMLDTIHKDGGDVKKYVAMAKDKNSSFRLMGFGHRVYKNYDPRAKVIKKMCDKVLGKLGINDPYLEIAKKLEETALKDEYFIEKKLYPNVDFYSGIVMRAIGIPTNMFTVMFAIGRLPGWIAHWKELNESPDMKLGRPRQIYVGSPLTPYVPVDGRQSGKK